MKNAVFWYVTLYGSSKNRRFGRKYRFHLLDVQIRELGNVINNYQPKHHALIVTANVVSSSLLLITLIFEAIRSSETSVPTRTTLHYMLKDGISHF
jgi:hypothetical protein